MISTIKIRHAVVAALALAFAATPPATFTQVAGAVTAEKTTTPVHDVAVEMQGQFEKFQNETRREIQQKSDQIRNELRRESIDRWAETVTWWLTVVLVILGFFALLVPVAGYLGYKKIDSEFAKAKELVDGIKDYEQQAEKSAQQAEENAQTIRNINSDTAKGVALSPGSAKSVELEEAVEEVRQNPDASLIDKAIAETYTLQKAGKTKEAIAKWLAIADLTEEIDNEVAARAWFSVGFLVEDYEEQIVAYTRAIQFNPEFSPAYNNRGAAKVALKQYDSAIPDFDKAIAITPEYSAAYSNRGGAKTRLGQYEDAIRDCDQAILIAPENATAYFHRGGAKVHLKRYESAIRDYDRAIHLEPKYILAYIDRGAAKARLNRFDDARSDIQIAMHFAKEISNEELVDVVSDKMREIDNLEAG